MGRTIGRLMSQEVVRFPKMAPGGQAVPNRAEMRLKVAIENNDKIDYVNCSVEEV